MKIEYFLPNGYFFENFDGFLIVFASYDKKNRGKLKKNHFYLG